jgi:hypothetical protein
LKAHDLIGSPAFIVIKAAGTIKLRRLHHQSKDA